MTDEKAMFISASQRVFNNNKTGKPEVKYFCSFAALDTYNSGVIVGYSASCTEKIYDQVKGLALGDVFSAVYTQNRGYTTLEYVPEIKKSK